VSLLPAPHFSPCFIKDPLIVTLADFLACFLAQKLPKRFVLVIDLEVFLLTRRSYFIGSEKKTIRIAIDYFSSVFG
jgi:hypothetical protein